jgi:hypothetical protein
VGSIQLSIHTSFLTHKPASFRAHPVTVPHPSCGHTFCAICMVKHFFSRFHRTCGGWHEHVECPMCRSILIYTPNQLPRSLLTFPFAKNRMADAAVVAMIDQLTAQIESTSTGILNPCEDLEGTKGGYKIDRESPLGVWRTGGSSRMEWLERLECVFQLFTFSPRFTHPSHRGVFRRGRRMYMCTTTRSLILADLFFQRKWIISVETGPRSLRRNLSRRRTGWESDTTVTSIFSSSPNS